MSQLYTSQPTVNRLLTTFSSLFPSATRRTRHLLAWLLIAQLALESAPSVRCLFRQFLSKQTDASLNSYYRALGNGLVTDASIRQALALQALAIVPEALRQEPILLSVDDTSIAKWGKHFDGVGILYDHAKHDGKSYFNGHAFVSLTMSVPVLHETAGKQQIRYIAVPYSGPVVKTSFSKTKRADWLPIREKLITLQRIRWTCLFWIDVLGLEVLPHATGCLSRRFPLTDSRWHEIIPDPSASFQTFSIDLVLRRKASVIQFIRSFIIQCFMWTYPVVFIDVCGN